MVEEGEFVGVDPFGVVGDGGADGGEVEGEAGVNGSLPADVVAVWGADPLARRLVGAWGLERFRGSWLHGLAVREAARVPRPRLRPAGKGGSR